MIAQMKPDCESKKRPPRKATSSSAKRRSIQEATSVWLVDATYPCSTPVPDLDFSSAVSASAWLQGDAAKIEIRVHALIETRALNSNDVMKIFRGEHAGVVAEISEIAYVDFEEAKNTFNGRAMAKRNEIGSHFQGIYWMKGPAEMRVNFNPIEGMVDGFKSLSS